MNTMSQRVAATFQRYRRYRRRVTTERILNQLPPSILRDIGWPDPDRIEDG